MATSKSKSASKSASKAAPKKGQDFRADSKPAPKKGEKNNSKPSLSENLDTDAQSNLNAPIVDETVTKGAKKSATVVSTKHSSGKWTVTETNADGSLKSQYLSDAPKGEVIRRY